MPFFDVVDDVTRYQMNKTEMGDTRISGVVIGQVVKNYDKDKQGFVQVNISTRDYQENKLVWARVALPYGGDKSGEYFIPEIGDQVILVFEQGNIERGFIIGAVPKTNSGFMKKAFDEHNDIKRIKTRNGNTIDIIDHHEGDGQKDKITITTSTEAHKIELDNEKKKILISDKEGKNKIEMKTDTGQMQINADQKLTIKVGDNISLVMNGANGSVTLGATKLKIETNNSTEIISNNRIKIEGGNVQAQGNSMLKLGSSGPVAIDGTPIKLG
nr:phage baseplate assembly protein V [uncultured Butyrivibrio sp.]